jgi:hypothetical protein
MGLRESCRCLWFPSSLSRTFKSKHETIDIQGIGFKNGLINIFNKEGIGNYDIALKDKN